ncbi:MAG: hypothetical protein QQM50_07690 [Dehalococcoides mccartyi]|uniref:hypothetical protein n=1 Tax=Dehalococcoides TaxID=61434 RepID=UPI00107E8087|nr:hypothetical protein [Dehalococcoides mccartyi]MDP4280406.1 hypothetical protein [Dehalococcoides mccartyi]QBX63320.1 hypothetical protein DhcFL2_00685 [Dehalococcoides mccartyi]
MTEKIVTQQYPGYPGTRPPKGWVPPLGQSLTLLGVYDNESGYWMGLPLQVLREALLNAEALQTEDRIDERDKIEVTVPNVSAQDVVKTTEFEVPSGEVWFLNRLNLVTEAEVSGNIRISKFPKVSDIDKKYLGTDQAAGSNNDYDLAAPGELGADLRLVGGDKITVVATVTAVGGTTADRKVTLNPYGRKANRLV